MKNRIRRESSSSRNLPPASARSTEESVANFVNRLSVGEVARVRDVGVCWQLRARGVRVGSGRPEEGVTGPDQGRAISEVARVRNELLLMLLRMVTSDWNIPCISLAGHESSRR